jgi:hypothetical protein
MQVRIHGVTIVTEEDHRLACALQEKLEERLAENEAVTQPAVTAGHKAHQAALAVRAYFCGPLEAGKKLLKRKIGDYREERDRKAAEDARQRQLLAAKQQEDERMARAEVLAAAGREQAALDLLAQEPEPVAISVQAPKLPSYGVVPQKRWSAELSHPQGSMAALDALILWVAADVRTRRGYLLANGPALNRAAVTAKSADLGIPGVRGVSKNV